MQTFGEMSCDWPLSQRPTAIAIEQIYAFTPTNGIRTEQRVASRDEIFEANPLAHRGATLLHVSQRGGETVKT